MNGNTLQRGAAVVTALFIVAIVSAMSVALMQRQQIDVQRTQLVIGSAKLRFAAQGATLQAEQFLRHYRHLARNKKRALAFPMNFPESSQGKLHSHVELINLDGLVNINSLLDPVQATIFLRLVLLVSPRLEPLFSHELLSAIQTKIAGARPPATNQVITTPSSFKPLLRGVTAVRAYHQVAYPFITVSQLRVLPGMSATLYNRLSPYLTALPRQTRINVNTAPPQVLQALSKKLTASKVAEIVSARRQQRFQKLTDFEQLTHVGAKSQALTVDARYFLIHASVTLATQHWQWFTIVQLPPVSPAGQAMAHKDKGIRRLWQSQNTR